MMMLGNPKYWEIGKKTLEMTDPALHAWRGRVQLPQKPCHHLGNTGEKMGLSRATWKLKNLNGEQEPCCNKDASTSTMLKASRSCITINGFNYTLKCQMIPPNI